MVVRINESRGYYLASAIYDPALLWKLDTLPDMMDCVSDDEDIMVLENHDFITIVGQNGAILEENAVGHVVI